jgi:hypothetical protein
VRKARQVGALYEGREPGFHGLNPLRFDELLIERSRGRKNEKGMGKGRSFFHGW